MSAITITKTLIRNADFSDGVNPRLRWQKLMPNVIYSGGITTAGSSLVGTITACVAFVEGYRVSVAQVSHTFTATKDTYVDVDQDGALQYSEVNNGAAEPSWAANSARLMKVVTDGDKITSVVDFRANNAGFGMGAPVGV